MQPELIELRRELQESKRQNISGKYLRSSRCYQSHHRCHGCCIACCGTPPQTIITRNYQHHINLPNQFIDVCLVYGLFYRQLNKFFFSVPLKTLKEKEFLQFESLVFNVSVPIISLVCRAKFCVITVREHSQYLSIKI